MYIYINFFIYPHSLHIHTGLRPMDFSNFSLIDRKVGKSAAAVTVAPAFTFAEIFAGIGGFRVGLERIGGECVLASEIDRHAVNTYRTNWPSSSHVMVGDICEYSCDVLPGFDILTGGFPCQSFSSRGSGEGLDCSNGQLYKELVRLLRAKRPKYTCT
jgi:site-specific DNA-cytosine methylase